MTGIRGVAAWLVVLFHTRVALAGIAAPWAIAAMAKGYLAVDLFFVLSGFVLWYNYAAPLATAGPRGVAGFYARRWARIWPLHALILAALVALALVLRLSGHDASPYPLAELPLHILLVQNWGFTDALSWNDPAWSISCEWGAYLLFPLTAAAFGRRALPAAALLAVGAGLLAAVALLFHGQILGHDVTHFGLPRCLLEFALGNIVCLLWRAGAGRRWIAPLAAATATLALGGGIALRLGEADFVPLGFAALLLALAAGRGSVVRALGGAVPVYLGEISYATYLAHVPLFTLFKIVAVRGTPALTWCQLAAFMLLVLGASVVLHHAVELPAQRRLAVPRRKLAIA